MTDGILAFIEARIGEEEETARAATPGLWVASHREIEIFDPETGFYRDRLVYDEAGADVRTEQDGAHIARQNPAVTLARCEALRGLVDLIVTWDEGTPEQSPVMPGDVLPRIAAIWRHHPDYREEWR
jgi:hypothetical protein